MDDLISRQAAIEAMRKAKDKSEAHRMLVQLPSAQPTVSKTEMLGDVISRQAAIKAIEFGITYARAINKETGEVKELFQEGNDELKKAVERVKHLPSVQPTGTKTVQVDDCISREAALTALERDEEYDKDIPNRADGVRDAIITISALPSAQPECEDAVSRQTLKDGFTEMCNLICPYSKKQQHVMCGSCLMGTAFDVLEATPPVTPKQRTGKWIKLDMHRGMADHKCTACEQECYVPTCMGEPMYAFCPNCGAKMEE